MLLSKIKAKYLNSLSLDKLLLSKNIGISLLSKGFALAVNFLTIPLLLSFLGKEVYGIWLTVFSVISWMSFFDLGLGNGLRNHLTHAFVNKEFDKAKEYVSTAYWLLGAFIVVCVLILQVLVFYLDWNKIFKPQVPINESFNFIVSICLWGFGVLLVMRLISSILQSKKRVGKSDFLTAIGGGICLISIFFISKFQVNLKLYYVAFVFSWIPPLVFLIYSFFFFKKNKDLLPRFHKINKELINDIFGLGLQFFMAQFLVLILNQSANIIITQVLSPSEVTIYYIPFRLFSIITITMGLISNNLLPYFTEAYAIDDFLKMKKLVYRFFMIFGGITIIFIFVLLFSDPIIKFWIADLIEIPFSLLILHFILALISSANGIFSSFLSGIGKLKKQIIVLAISAFIFIVLSIFLGQKIGLNGIILSLIIAQLPVLMVLSIQSIKILKTGIKK